MFDFLYSNYPISEILLLPKENFIDEYSVKQQKKFISQLIFNRTVFSLMSDFCVASLRAFKICSLNILYLKFFDFSHGNFSVCHMNKKRTPFVSNCCKNYPLQ